MAEYIHLLRKPPDAIHGEDTPPGCFPDGYK